VLVRVPAPQQPHRPTAPQRNWDYDPSGTTHNDRIGQILARGVDLSATLKQNAAASVKTARAAELHEKNSQHAAPTMDLQGTASEAPKADGRGMVWVGCHGQCVWWHGATTRLAHSWPGPAHGRPPMHAFHLQKATAISRSSGGAMHWTRPGANNDDSRGGKALRQGPGPTPVRPAPHPTSRPSRSAPISASRHAVSAPARG
jgi:hypothetical protein